MVINLQPLSRDRKIAGKSGIKSLLEVIKKLRLELYLYPSLLLEVIGLGLLPKELLLLGLFRLYAPRLLVVGATIGGHNPRSGWEYGT